MTDVISSDLLQQLMTLSDMSTYSKFLAMNQDWISLIFSLIPFAVFFLYGFPQKQQDKHLFSRTFFCHRLIRHF